MAIVAQFEAAGHKFVQVDRTTVFKGAGGQHRLRGIYARSLRGRGDAEVQRLFIPCTTKITPTTVKMARRSTP